MSQFTDAIEKEIKFLEAEVEQVIHIIETTSIQTKKDDAWKQLLRLRSQIGHLKALLKKLTD